MPKNQTFTKPPSSAPRSNLGAIPKFQKTSGVKNGSTPPSPHLAAPARAGNTKSLLNSFPGPSGYPGTITIQH